MPAPGLCIEARAERGVPFLIERLRATPFEVGVVGEDRDGDAPGGSVEALRPPAVPDKGFFVAADILCSTHRGNDV